MGSKSKGHKMYVLEHTSYGTLSTTLADSPSLSWGLGQGEVFAREGRAFKQAWEGKLLSNGLRSALAARGWHFKQLVVGSARWKQLMLNPLTPAGQPPSMSQVTVDMLMELLNRARARSRTGFTPISGANVVLVPIAPSPTQPIYPVGRNVAAMKAAGKYRFKEAGPEVGDVYMVNNVPMEIVDLDPNGLWFGLESARGTRVTAIRAQLGVQYPLVSKAADTAATLQKLQNDLRILNERQRSLQAKAAALSQQAAQVSQDISATAQARSLVDSELAKAASNLRRMKTRQTPW